MDKQYILDEIRRTAKNGIPLGRLKFFKETGIKESDWQGRFWVRWSEAVQEAGFQPNQMTTAYEESELLEKLCGLISELGHFPVAAELRMKEHKDSSFPNSKTFRRFGTKQQLVTKVRAYCDTHELGNILALCPVLTIDSDVRSTYSDSKEVFGFVYLLKSGRHYKIGRSNAVGRRERELAIQLPDRASAVHSIRTDDPAGIEDYWHRRFETKRKNGEWFELDSSDVKAFKRRTFM